MINKRQRLIPGCVALLLTSPALAHAAPPERSEADVSFSSEAATDPPRWDERKDRKWIERWSPENNMVELGVYGGILLLNEQHELFSPDRDLELQGFRRLQKINPDVGLRFGYYPSRFVGLEVEGGVLPSRLRDGSAPALLYTARGHLVLQLGLWSVTPFVLVGGGGLGVASERAVLGNDIDPAVHFGGGLKFYLNRWVMLRVDVRDVLTHQQGVDNTLQSHNLEALLGLSFTLGRKNQRPIRPDRDLDGFYDDEDVCPDHAGVSPDGCPIHGRDRDRDGIDDSDDLCVDQAETVNGYDDQDGCPESDRDGDGFWDELDTCPDQAGIDPDGCPVADTDGDGFTDDIDQCVEQAETVNGYLDGDGCPDEVPKALARFTGTIQGIQFDVGKAEVSPASRRTLDEAVKVLNEYPDIRIEITGHTDNRGDHDVNLELSRQRAAAVKTYLVERGIDSSRVETQGYGPDKPVDSNDTKTGRANNRRIEFKLLPPS